MKDERSRLFPAPAFGGDGDTAAALLAAEEDTGRFGLALTQQEATALARHRRQALTRAGRVEVGPGALPALARAFCDSPYIAPREWADILAALLDAFYAFKAEAGERIPDDELIALMRRAFDGPCGGDVSYMDDVTMGQLCQDTRWETYGLYRPEDTQEDDRP